MKSDNEVKNIVFSKKWIWAKYTLSYMRFMAKSIIVILFAFICTLLLSGFLVGFKQTQSNILIIIVPISVFGFVLSSFIWALFYSFVKVAQGKVTGYYVNRKKQSGNPEDFSIYRN